MYDLVQRENSLGGQQFTSYYTNPVPSFGHQHQRSCIRNFDESSVLGSSVPRRESQILSQQNIFLERHLQPPSMRTSESYSDDIITGHGHKNMEQRSVRTHFSTLFYSFTPFTHCRFQSNLPILSPSLSRSDSELLPFMNTDMFAIQQMSRLVTCRLILRTLFSLVLGILWTELERRLPGNVHCSKPRTRREYCTTGKRGRSVNENKVLLWPNVLSMEWTNALREEESEEELIPKTRTINELFFYMYFYSLSLSLSLSLFSIFVFFTCQ